MSANWDPPPLGLWASIIWALGLCATAAAICLWAIGYRNFGRWIAGLAVVASAAPCPVILWFYAPQAPEEKPFLAGGLAGVCLVQWLIWMLLRFSVPAKTLGVRRKTERKKVQKNQEDLVILKEGEIGKSEIRSPQPWEPPYFPSLPVAHGPFHVGGDFGQALPPLSLPPGLAWEHQGAEFEFPIWEPQMLAAPLHTTEESSGILALESGDLDFEPQFPEPAWPAEIAGREPNPREAA